MILLFEMCQVILIQGIVIRKNGTSYKFMTLDNKVALLKHFSFQLMSILNTISKCFQMGKNDREIFFSEIFNYKMISNLQGIRLIFR